MAAKIGGLFFGPSGGFLLKKFREAVGRDCAAGETSKAADGVQMSPTPVMIDDCGLTFLSILNVDQEYGNHGDGDVA